MFDFSAMNVKGSTKGTNGTYVKVTSGILRQVEGGGLRQAQITINGPEAKFRGVITFSIGEEKYSLYKGDTHSLWAVHQKTDEQLAQFGKLFNALMKKPDEVTNITL